MSVPLLIPDAESEFPALLLELTVAGVIYRFAELGPLDVTDGDDVLHYHAGLATSMIEETIDLWGTTATSRSIDVEVELGTGLTLQDLLQAGGEELMAATARLLLWTGGEYDDSQVMAQGRVSSPIYGEPDLPEILSFTIDRDLTDRALIPAAKAYLHDDSFALVGAPDDGEIGIYYPIIIGRPGYSTTALSGVRKCVPVVRANVDVVLATNARLIVAGHRVAASELRLWSSNNTSEVASILEGTDEYGVVYSYADLSTVAAHTAYSDGSSPAEREFPSVHDGP